MSDAFRAKELAKELDMTEYEAYRDGLVPRVPFDHPRLVELRQYVANFDELVDECCEIMYLFAARERNGKLPSVNAWDHSLENMRLQNVPWGHLRESLPRKSDEYILRRWKDRIHVMLMGVLNVLAKEDLRYWGVDDLSQKGYCAGCRQPRAVEDFEDGSRTCTPCREYRKRNPKYSPKRKYVPVAERRKK